MTRLLYAALHCYLAALALYAVIAGAWSFAATLVLLFGGGAPR